MKTRFIRLMATLTLLAAFSLYASAQEKEKSKPKPTAEQRAEKKVSHMINHLNLTTEQTVKIKDLVLTQEKLKDEKMKELKESHEKLVIDIGKVLTPEQMTKFKEVQDKKMNRKKPIRRNRVGNPEPEN